MNECKMGETFIMHGEMRNVYKILVGKPQRKELQRPMCRWEVSINVNLKGTVCEISTWR
jgi:hypothetical protein